MTLLAFLGWCGGASAQNLVTLQFSFSNPGARSLGLGGAFAALADDATAAYVNPAGLTQLVEPEVSIEGRTWDYTTSYVQSGRASGSPTGIGIDTESGIRYGESTASFEELSFLSVVYPRGHLSFALYRHQLAKFASSFEPKGLFGEGTTLLDTDRWREQPGSNDLDIVNNGLAVGYRLNDSLSLGLGVSFIEAEFGFRSAVYLPDNDTLAGFFGENHLLPSRLILETDSFIDGSDWAFTGGMLWRATETWRLGVFFRSGFEMIRTTTFTSGPQAPPGFPPVVVSEANWEFPSVYGAGIAFRSRDGRMTTSIEWDRVSYSTMLQGDEDETFPDADELHIGGEYVILRSTPVVALRLGAWLDPDHRIRATSGSDLFFALLPPGDDEVHLSAGVGLAFEDFQIDLAADFSDPVNTVSISAISSF